MAFFHLVFITVTAVFMQIQPVHMISQRKIYTLFTTPKTWNEAHDICESQFGQLVKIRGAREIEELNYLDDVEWAYKVNTTLHGNGFWSGLHRPFSTLNDTWEYQDCESISSDLTFQNPGLISANQHCGVFKGANYDLYEAPCSERKTFICLRFIGDCWYEPFPETIPNNIPPSDVIAPYTAADASDCAMGCRHEASPECWAFMWDETAPDPCLLMTKTEQTASSYYVKEVNRAPGNQPDMVFYVRRCFEGVLDTKTYNSYSDTSATPNSYCTTHVYEGEPAAQEICYCSTQDHPPIPPALSSEAMAEQYAKELTLDTSNTSSAQRKLISAEDNRPSAVGVGFLGVGLLTAVFGGLFLMDIPVFYSTLKELLCTKVQAVHTESAVPTETDC